MNQQLPLALRWPRRQRFEHFHAGSNAGAVDAMQCAATDEGAPWVVLTGPRGSGKTHLLLAACQAAADAGRWVQYLPLGALLGTVADTVRRSSEGAQLLALDDVHVVAGDAAVEHALFDVYNRCKAEGVNVVFATDTAPSQLALKLPDLRSRLGACQLQALKPLDEAERRDILRTHAAARGIELDDAVMSWLFGHYERDLGALQDLLERLDRASLAAKRRITVPFLRDFLRQG
ncbi:DnaA regulatory inactivator Hda [Oleiagrimonas sp. C23AA]|uniref:DnaA regulatory inactivator Hda n=1 Tax=Oleiagrimonas sp. C23AA TaxID=2719047 RepID=UPI0014232F4B|nr:DnaA regulatory inactivator Hda [Oleiagrimonas sp. C23AA]NII11535.1 DnaA regulatory inactivator Hda [Oleiagrimonas sp. C23AA]